MLATQVKEVTTHLVHFAGAVSLQDGDIVEELLAEWAVSSPHARFQFAVALRLGQPSCVRDVQEEAITKYASEVLPLHECCELMLKLRAPQSAWHTLSKVYTLPGLKYTAATGLPFACRICPERALQQLWQEVLAPLELELPVSTSHPKATSVSPPWASWLRYIASQPPLCRMIDGSFPLTFIVRADGYPCAGGEWSQLSVTIVNMGLWGRISACVWIIGLAICGDKQMATLATPWKANIEVCFVHQQFAFVFLKQSSSLWTPKQVVYNARDHPSDVWLVGDSPWVRHIIGISPAPQFGSLYNEAIWDSDARVWMGKDVVRTTRTHHEQQTSFLLGTPSLKAVDCPVEPVVVIARCRVVMCILHRCMALGRLQMANIERFANDRLAPGDQVTRAAIQATLHEHRTGCRMGKDASADGEETSRLFAAWPNLALLLVVARDEPLYKAVVDMAQSLRDLYHTYQVGPRPQCRGIAAAFCGHCAPGSTSHYLFFFFLEDAYRLLEATWPFSMAMFSNDIIDSLNAFLKQAFNEHHARGGGKQKATVQSAGGRPEASLDSDADAPGHVLQWGIPFFYIHLHLHDAVRHVPCVPKASLESVPHSPPPFLSSLLSYAPQHRRDRQRRFAGPVGCRGEGNTKHAGGCVRMHACEFVHCAWCIVAFARGWGGRG